MKKLKCFLCGARYNPEKRENVATIYEYGSDEPAGVNSIRIRDGHTLRLCPACIKAASLGIVLAMLRDPTGLRWGEDLEFEEEWEEDGENEQIQ